MTSPFGVEHGEVSKMKGTSPYGFSLKAFSKPKKETAFVTAHLRPYKPKKKS